MPQPQPSPAPDPRSAEAFAALLSPARHKMLLVALAIVADRTDAEDVLQDACVTGLNKYRSGEFVLGTNFDAWMGQITRYTALNARRARRNGPAPLGDNAQRISSSPSPAAVSSTMDAIEDADLRKALEQLAETARLCLVLRVVGGLPYSTIASIAGVPEGTAMSHVHRAQRTLRQVLTDRVDKGDSAGGAGGVGGAVNANTVVRTHAPGVRTTTQGGAR